MARAGQAVRQDDNLRVDFVLDMVDAMCAQYGAELDDKTIVHSDQGCHYTSNAFIQKHRGAAPDPKVKRFVFPGRQ